MGSDALPSLRSLARPALFALLALLSVMLLPLELSLLAIILLTTGFILADARRNPILFKMAVRSVTRRRSTTILVLGGLMVGTAIIASSFVVGDTMNNMITGEVTKGAGEVDFLIGSQADNGWRYFDQHNQTLIRNDLSRIDHVESVEWTLMGSTGLMDRTSQMASTSADYMGVNANLTEKFGGFLDLNGNKVTTVPAAGHIYMNEKLAKELDAHVGDEIMVPQGQSYVVVVLDMIVQDRYLGGFEGSSRIFLDLSTTQSIAGTPEHSNFIMLALDGSVGEGTASTGPVREEVERTLAAYSWTGLTVLFDKSETLEEGREQMAMFTSLFLVMGSFSIIAGIALVINIFTMLGEERKGEMGMARAVGMQKEHLRRLFTYEGLIYALLAAGIGAVVGLGLAYLIILGFAATADMGVPFDQYFTFTPFSLTIAYMAGFLLTIGTVYLTTRRISNMNIVRAIRNIPEPAVSREDRRTFRMGLVALAGGFLLMALGIAFEALAPALSGLSLAFLSLGLLLRKYVTDRAAWNVAGLASLVIWMPLPFQIFPYAGNIEMFAVSGIFMVTSLLVLVMFNSDQIIKVLTKLLRVKGGYIAVVKTAISYPLKAKFRTALSIFIFGLVIFTVTVLTMISGILAVGIPQMVSETSGGFDIVGMTNPSTPVTIDLWDDIQSSQGLIRPENITNVVPLVSSYPNFIKGDVPQAGDNALYDKFRYITIGFGSRFYTEGDYPLTDWNTTLYATEEDAWEAVLGDPSLCIIDGSGSGEMSFDMGGGSPMSGLKVGDKLTVVTPGDGSGEVNVVLTIAGITKQSFFSGVFVSEELVKEALMSPYPSIFMIKVAPGADVDRQAILLEKQYLGYGMNTISVASMAQEAASQINGVFNLLKAFLAMGLVIGISGLGIITIRSINERKVEIGMMRAIGYTRRMVITNFAMESAFISVLGIVAGTFLGIVIGYQLWDTGFSTMGFDFVIDWMPILLVGFGAFLATLLSVYPAARGASKVSPAEVLRFE